MGATIIRQLSKMSFNDAINNEHLETQIYVNCTERQHDCHAIGNNVEI